MRLSNLEREVLKSASEKSIISVKEPLAPYGKMVERLSDRGYLKPTSIYVGITGCCYRITSKGLSALHGVPFVETTPLPQMTPQLIQELREKCSMYEPEPNSFSKKDGEEEITAVIKLVV